MSIYETPSFVILNAQRSGKNLSLWVLDKDIISEAASVLKIVEIGGANSKFYNGIREIEEHSYFGLIFAATA